MTSKTIPFKQPTGFSRPAEDWVGATLAAAPPVVAAKPELPTKRLTVDIPEDLHRRIKVDCAGKGTQISDVVRELLTKEYPVA